MKEELNNNAKLTKVYMDTEFTGLQMPTSLISIGLISECGKTFYAEFTDYNKEQVTPWIQENVIDKLIYKERFNETSMICYPSKSQIECFGLKWMIRCWLEQYFNQFEQVEIYSDCLSYDWVLFNDVFGDAFSIPENVYYIPFDICTTFKEKGIDPDISRELYAKYVGEDQKHNAFFDAKIIKACHERLMQHDYYQELIYRAKELVSFYFRFKFDKGGAPYIEHLFAVADNFDPLIYPQEHILAILHDLVEDINKFRTNPEVLKDIFGEVIYNGLIAITKNQGEDYYNYLDRVKQNDLALPVKKKDIEHNMKIDRIKNPIPKDYARIEKYAKALEYLTNC
jgi:hypothetical protein